MRVTSEQWDDRRDREVVTGAKKPLWLWRQLGGRGRFSCCFLESPPHFSILSLPVLIAMQATMTYYLDLLSFAMCLMSCWPLQIYYLPWICTEFYTSDPTIELLLQMGKNRFLERLGGLFMIKSLFACQHLVAKISCKMKTLININSSTLITLNMSISAWPV